MSKSTTFEIKPNVVRNGLFAVAGKPNLTIGVHTGRDEYSLTLDPWELQKLVWFLEKELAKFKIFMGPGEGWDLPEKDSKYGRKIIEEGKI